MDILPINGDMRRHGPIKPSIFGPKLVHLLLSSGSHRSSTAGKKESEKKNGG